jgi:hypothetical protein
MHIKSEPRFNNYDTSVAIITNALGPRPVKRRAFFAGLIVWALTASICSAAAQSKTRQIRIEYVRPTNLVHLPIYEQMKEARVLEYIRDMLGSIRLPRPLPFRLTGCDGEANAWYDNGAITVCYEFIEEILKNAPTRDLPLGITKSDTIAGPLLDVFMHEAGHAVFDMLQVPLFGREEDAADQFSAYIMLQYDKARARGIILGSAYQYAADIRQPQVTLALKKFADEHGIPAQRFYNVLCIAYGADPKLFADVVERGYLPKERAESCEDEYRQVNFAFKTLISRHVDSRLAGRSYKKRFKKGALQ